MNGRQLRKEAAMEVITAEDLAGDMDGEYVTRKDIARLMGISVESVKSRISANPLCFGIVRQSRRAADGSIRHLYPLKVVMERVNERKLGAKSRKAVDSYHNAFGGHDVVTYTAEEARTVFEALGEGQSLASIVTEDGIHPQKVKAISLEWMEMTGGLILTAKDMETISDLPLDGVFPMQKGSLLVELITKTVEERDKPRPCKRCRRHPALMCKDCAPIYTLTQLKKEKLAASAATRAAARASQEPGAETDSFVSPEAEEESQEPSEDA